MYADIRDTVVDELLTEFGTTATLRTQAKTYNTVTAEISTIDTDTTIKIVRLPTPAKGGKYPEFTDDQINLFSQVLIVSAKELVAPDIEIRAEDLILMDSNEYRIVGVKTVQPADIILYYKVGIAGARD